MDFVLALGTGHLPMPERAPSRAKFIPDPTTFYSFEKCLDSEKIKAPLLLKIRNIH